MSKNPVKINEVLPHLFLVDLDQEPRGFRQFINAWIYRRNGVTLVIDPGPSSTIPVLYRALQELGIQKVDYILLTHIHIDHAGGTGALLRHYPETKVNCHPKGLSHLADPQKLWAGSLKVLGSLAEAYGKIPAVPEQNLSWNEQLEIGGLTIDAIETPGHASHHVCYQIGDLLFAGEVAGVNAPCAEGDYLRIATPPPFYYEVYENSLLKAATIKAQHVFFGHYGMRSDGSHIFNMARQQLEIWMRVIAENRSTADAQSIFKKLLEEDPSLQHFFDLPEDIQERESYFCLNSIRGMLDYFEKT